jgi:hypothetical protein
MSPPLQVLTLEHAPGILRSCVHLACVVEGLTVAQRSAELLTLLLAAGADGPLLVDQQQGRALVGAAVRLLECGCGDPASGASRAGVALLQHALTAGDTEAELELLANGDGLGAVRALCGLLATGPNGTGGTLCATGHAALRLLHRVVVEARCEGAVEAVAWAGLAAALLPLLPAGGGEEVGYGGAWPQAPDNAVVAPAAELLRALAGTEAGALAIHVAPGGWERLAACLGSEGPATAAAAAGALACLCAQFPSDPKVRQAALCVAPAG